jgi:hypothetical protein
VIPRNLRHCQPHLVHFAQVVNIFSNVMSLALLASLVLIVQEDVVSPRLVPWVHIPLSMGFHLYLNASVALLGILIR